MKKIVWLSICFICLLSLSLRAEVVPLDTIPFELGTDNRLYVTVYINGQDDRPLRFLLDTGATDVVLNSNSLRTEGLATFTGSVENSGANSVETIPSTESSQVVRMGSRAISGLKLIAIPYPPDAWDGVLGLSYLRNFDVRIDYRRKSIFLYELGDGQKAASDKDVRLKMDYCLGVPVVPVGVRVGGVDYLVSVEVDTGSDRVFDLNTPFVRRNGLLGTQKPFAISRIAGTVKDGGELQNVYFDSVTLGDALTLPRIPGAFSTVTAGVQASDAMDGVLGNNFLQRFNQLYDFKNNYLYLEVNDRLYTPFYDFLVR
ncbi:retroviral-like aspartic protease family protein [Bacteroides ndongoniae]|uniref:retroviral-like aspartic protease family protein n=1 Tax=Bacteroides ndongoniae TaxID=1903262 RepID=UPI0008DA9D33|nr:retroviral-like aspartic protease family protein [Bacteroides ndongoniae]